MKKLGSGISQYMSQLGGDDALIRKAHRGAQVRSMWAKCVDDIFLDHTNSVYIIKEGENKILIVYVDESIYAAELNARRELIKLKMLQSFGENIHEFRILISRGSYKKNYPYKKIENMSVAPRKLKELHEEEKKRIDEIISPIENEELKDSLKKAMIADWRWQKTNNN